MQNFYQKIKRFTKHRVEKKYNNFTSQENLSEEDVIFEKYRIKNRFEEEIIEFKGRKLIVPDAVSFAYQVKEIFSHNIYYFESDTKCPKIYDCGANIGLSVLYFKKIFPKAKIKAFEADKKIFSVLKKNVGHLDDLELNHCAIWTNEDTLMFNSEGADGGSLIGEFDEKQKVQSVRLRDILEKEGIIDFLKMDIEGAEINVIKDCDRVLNNVQNIFIEYHSFKNSEQELHNILKILKNSGFRYYLETIKKPPNPFFYMDDDHPMDLQVNIFGVRNLKK